VAALRGPELLDRLSAHGFQHVWIDRWGYPGRSPGIEKELATNADAPPLVSDDGRYAVYCFTRGRHNQQTGGK
jgi:hypothetical protein